MESETGIAFGPPTLAVLPFVAGEEDGDIALLAQGLTEDVCGELTRFRSLRIIAPGSSARLVDATDTEIGARLGASYVLRGRLRGAGDVGLTLMADLTAVGTQTQLWSEKFKLPWGDPYAVAEGVVGRIAATLSARFEKAALAEARHRPASDLKAWQLAMRGLILVREGTREASDAARDLFERALDLEPLYARAHAGLSLCWFNQWNCQFWDRFDEASRNAYRHARKALELDDSDAMSHLVIAQVALFHKEWEQAAWYIDRGIALCPNDADILVTAALMQVYLGHSEQAAANVAHAIALNPYHPSEYFGVGAFAAFFSGETSKGLKLWEQCNMFPLIDGPAFASAAYAHNGQPEIAARELARFIEGYREKIAFGRDFAPDAPLAWLFRVNPFRREEDLAFLRSGFERIGALDGRQARMAGARTSTPSSSASLLRKGEAWALSYAGQQTILPDLKGLHDISRLMQRPNEEIHCLDLDERLVEAPGESMLDEKARNALKARLRELQEDLAEAEARNDIGCAELVRDEMDAIVETLSAALGLGGRRRKLGDSAEKARTAVTWRIRHAIRRIQAAHPELGEYLSMRVETGTFCRFRGG